MIKGHIFFNLSVVVLILINITISCWLIFNYVKIENILNKQQFCDQNEINDALSRINGQLYYLNVNLNNLETKLK